MSEPQRIHGVTEGELTEIEQRYPRHADIAHGQPRPGCERCDLLLLCAWLREVVKLERSAMIPSLSATQQAQEIVRSCRHCCKISPGRSGACDECIARALTTQQEADAKIADTWPCACESRYGRGPQAQHHGADCETAVGENIAVAIRSAGG